MPIFLLPTPEQLLHIPVFNDRGVSFYLKRDDIIHPFISGNKWRKLNGIVKKAQEYEAKTLISYGGAFSNHLLALACAGAVFGYKTKGMVRGEPVQNHVLFLCRHFGMELTFIGREAMKEIRLSNTELVFQDGDLFIPEGGACAEGMEGCKLLTSEFENNYEHIVLAVGTGTTLKGLALGLQTKQTLHGIVVLMDETFKQFETNQIKIYLEFHAGGYAKTNSNLIALSRDFASKTGILLDPVYTLKTYYAACELSKQGVFKPGEKVLMLHSGGLSGWLSPKYLS
jgi:1-aminocyclopropane-1-carboxylate deaminase